jgi:hypothetical protein
VTAATPEAAPESALPLQGVAARGVPLPFGPAELLEESRARAEVEVREAAPTVDPLPAREPAQAVAVSPVLSLDVDDDFDGGTPLELADRHTPADPLPPSSQPANRALDRDMMGSPSAPEVVPHDAGQDLRDRYAMGDYSGALIVAEGILEASPGDPEAERYAQGCRDVLVQMYSSRLGSLERVPRVAVPPDQIRWLSLDHRAGFLLSLVDGTARLEDILDMSGMPRLDALRILHTLFEQQVIALE